MLDIQALVSYEMSSKIHSVHFAKSANFGRTSGSQEDWQIVESEFGQKKMKDQF